MRREACTTPLPCFFRGDPGFTLLEILVAISLLFIVLVTVYQSFHVHVQSIERAIQVQRKNQAARLVLSMIARDLQNAYWPLFGEDELEEEETESGKPLSPEGQGIIHFLVQPIQEGGRPWDRLLFLTKASGAGPFFAQDPWVHLVEYRLARDEDTGRPVLVRREDLMPQRDSISGGEEWPLSDSVVGFEVVCYGEDGKPVNGWDSRTEEALPLAVLIKLWIQDPLAQYEEPQLFTLRVALPPSEEETLEERSR